MYGVRRACRPIVHSHIRTNTILTREKGCSFGIIVVRIFDFVDTFSQRSTMFHNILTSHYDAYQNGVRSTVACMFLPECQ